MSATLFSKNHNVFSVCNAADVILCNAADIILCNAADIILLDYFLKNPNVLLPRRIKNHNVCCITPVLYCRGLCHSV